MKLDAKKTALLAVGLILVAAFAYVIYLDYFKPADYEYRKVAGVDVYTSINISEFMAKKNVALHQTDDRAAQTCSFEISSASTADRKGYEIIMERGNKSVYIDKKIAYIRGETDDELLQACHVFMCLREGISCPENLMDARNATLNKDRLILVIDNTAGPNGYKGYIEILGALGFVQAYVADQNRDGTISEDEKNKNKVFIYPYVKDGDACRLQNTTNALQKLNVTDNTVNCSAIEGGILITGGDNKIEIGSKRITVSGDESHIRVASVILRDTLSPEWIRFYYGLY